MAFSDSQTMCSIAGLLSQYHWHLPSKVGSHVNESANKEGAPRASASQLAPGLKTCSIDDVYRTLQSSPDGLSEAQAEERLAKYGPNELQGKRAIVSKQFLNAK
jgi:hypothetical protein